MRVLSGYAIWVIFSEVDYKGNGIILVSLVCSSVSSARKLQKSKKRIRGGCSEDFVTGAMPDASILAIGKSIGLSTGYDET